MFWLFSHSRKLAAGLTEGVGAIFLKLSSSHPSSTPPTVHFIFFFLYCLWCVLLFQDPCRYSCKKLEPFSPKTHDKWKASKYPQLTTLHNSSEGIILKTSAAADLACNSLSCKFTETKISFCFRAPGTGCSAVWDYVFAYDLRTALLSSGLHPIRVFFSCESLVYEQQQRILLHRELNESA